MGMVMYKADEVTFPSFGLHMSPIVEMFAMTTGRRCFSFAVFTADFS